MANLCTLIGVGRLGCSALAIQGGVGSCTLEAAVGKFAIFPVWAGVGGEASAESVWDLLVVLFCFFRQL